jgi:hypothetical protein
MEEGSSLSDGVHVWILRYSNSPDPKPNIGGGEGKL